MRLDSLDIEGLFPLYKRVEQHLHHFPKERSRLQVEGPYDEMFLEKLQKCPSEDDGSVEYATTKVRVLAQSWPSPGPVLAQSWPSPGSVLAQSSLTFRTFSFSVAVLDLDPKPFESVPRQLRLDQKVVNGYLRSSSGICPKTPQQREDCTLLFHPVRPAPLALLL
uniref:Inositol-pentakisphosphate 2-kinase n=1 Tax=Periophthalmus magnuspinnatus TaxID=409849 RepID=A0A3B4B495_9GOBI